jgi:tetratricopeptide (TPR) repeat protein
MRQYAEEKLIEAGQAEMLRTRHRDWYLSLAEHALGGMEGADQKRWWDRLEVEHDNLRVALTRSATDPTSPHELLRFAGMLGRFWQIRGYLHEGIGWLEMALARTEVTPSAGRARVLNWLGQLEAINGNLGCACPALEESIAQARAVGDRRVLSLALRHLGLAVLSIGDYALSRQLIDEALAVSRETGYNARLRGICRP